MKECELCNVPARMYCESDQASLCFECDAKVHGANFLVARHSRSLLCQTCQSPTPWKASGPKLDPAISVCERCVSRCNGRRDEEHQEADGENEMQDDDEDDSDNDDGDDDEEEDGGGVDDDDDDDEDGDNQVVPWSSTRPPVASSTSSEESSRRLGGGGAAAAADLASMRFSLKRM